MHKFFHVATTNRYIHNTITLLSNEKGFLSQDMRKKATLLYENFNLRMGVTADPIMLFDLPILIQLVDDLDCLILPFRHDEADKVIMSMPTDKAPGLDSFNGKFIKTC